MWLFAKWAEQLFDTLKPGDPYYRHWVRFRQGLFLRLWGGCIFGPLFLTIVLGLAWFLPMPAAWATSAIVLFGVVSFSYYRYPLLCPSCKKPFYGHLDPRHHAAMQERCLQCGLQVYAPWDE